MLAVTVQLPDSVALGVDFECNLDKICMRNIDEIQLMKCNGDCTDLCDRA